MHNPTRRYRQLRRVLLILELLAPLRYGASLPDLRTDVVDALGPIHERTILRDLQTLESIGFVERRGGQWVYVRSPRSKFLETLQTLFSL